jgi:hypothetical protein
LRPITPLGTKHSLSRSSGPTSRYFSGTGRFWSPCAKLSHRVERRCANVFSAYLKHLRSHANLLIIVTFEGGKGRGGGGCTSLLDYLVLRLQKSVLVSKERSYPDRSVNLSSCHYCSVSWWCCKLSTPRCSLATSKNVKYRKYRLI